MIYSITDGKLVPADVPESHRINNLPVGTIIKSSKAGFLLCDFQQGCMVGRFAPGLWRDFLLEKAVLNLTPHEITLITPRGIFTFPPSGTVARVETLETVIGECPITGAAIVRREKGRPTGMPPAGTVCLVSSMVLEECPGRAGVFAPDSGKTAIRNEKGHVVGVTQLVAA